MINRECFDVFSVKAGFCINANPEGLAGPARLLAFVFLSLCLSTTALAQSQLGTGIDGEAAGDSSGYSASLSSDGNRLAIGAVGNDGNGDRSGHVRVYQWSNTTWEQLGSDIDGEAVRDTSGRSVSLSSDGNRLAIGANWNDGNGEDSGHVRIYQWTGTAWVQLGDDIDGEATFNESGSALSLSGDGNRVAIGARWNWSNNRQAGHVRVYQWSNSAWVQLGLDINGDESEDQFGRRVSLSSDGNRLAVGAPYANESLTLLSNGPPTTKGGLYGAGLVRVYQWSDSVWAQVGNDIDGEALGDRLGEAVSLSADGNRMAIGIPSSSGYERSTGRVRVFQWFGSAWTPLGIEIVGEAVGDQFGRHVSLSQDGNRLAIGTPFNDVNGEYSGHVRVYQWSDEDWAQLGVDIDGESAGDWSGSVSMSSDGNRLAVGAQGYDSNGEDSGRVRVYDLSMFNAFRINAGLNDAWYNPETSGQGFFITVFPEIGYVSLAWFTYDTEFPPIDATANLGDPGHRWLTAVGPIDGNQALMNIEMTSGGLFDTASEITRTDPPGSDGTILLTFDSCNSGTIEYDIPSINRHGIVPIKRVANDNIVLCEALSKD